ncbi:MAG: universal stress protein [Myxococcota bacterium]
MTQTKSTVLTVTDLTLASYGLVGFAAVLAKAGRGEVFLVSTHRGRAESKPVTDERPSAPPPTAALRHEGQLLEQQRKWCADHGVRCRAELLEDAAWPELVIRSARRVRADLILLAAQFRGASGRIIPQEMQSLAQDAPCPVSLVRLPGLWAYKNHA